MARQWKPGRRYRTAIRNTSWWRNNRGGTITAVAVVLPKTLPAFDGGEWTRHELWTVRLPIKPGDVTRARPFWKPWRHYWLADGPVYMLLDKPHRVTWWDKDDPRREVLDRRPLPASLVARLRTDHRRQGFEDVGDTY